MLYFLFTTFHLALTGYLVWVVAKLNQDDRANWQHQTAINDRVITLLDATIPTQHKMWEELRRMNHKV